MAAKAEQGEVVKRALAMLHSKPGPAFESPPRDWTEPKPSAETLAASVLAESKPDEAISILAIWEEVFGMTLDRQRVAKHLEGLRQWQSRWRKDERPD